MKKKEICNAVMELLLRLFLMLVVLSDSIKHKDIREVRFVETIKIYVRKGQFKSRNTCSENRFYLWYLGEYFCYWNIPKSKFSIH